MSVTENDAAVTLARAEFETKVKKMFPSISLERFMIIYKNEQVQHMWVGFLMAKGL